MSKKLDIALVAHDARKGELIEWCKYNIEWLSRHNLYATGTTGKLIEDINTKWVPQENGNLKIEGPLVEKVTCVLSGPLGGDQQIGAMVAEDKIDVLIFFCDNMETQGHQQDIGALSRLASLYNIAFATNRKTADLIITSSLLEDESYERIIPSVIERYKNRMQP